MRSHRNSKPTVDGAPVVVSANTLKEAYAIVREDYGEDAIILGTRTVNQRQELGLGHERQVQVTIQMPGATVPASPLGRRGGPGALDRILAGHSEVSEANKSQAVEQEIEREVNRIEELVSAIAEDHARLSKLRLPLCDNPLAETLIENGATAEAVNTLLTRFITETGSDVRDRPAAVSWLTENLRASNCTWEDFYGCHAFLGESGSGRSDLVLTAAGILQNMGRRTLVLSLMPGNNGDIKRLQLEAALKGFDAAVIKKESQLASTEKHLAEYDVVLVDMPDLHHEVMGEDGQVHAWLARNTSFHRHLLVPMDKDPRDMSSLNLASRSWNCDWLAVSRTDMTNRPAKMLDLLERIPVPVSLIGKDPARTGCLEIAQSDRVLDSMLSGTTTEDFTPGVEAQNTPVAAETAEVAW